MVETSALGDIARQQAMGQTPDDADERMGKIGFALHQEGLDALWEGIRAKDPQVKLSAIQTYVKNWEGIQQLGAEDDKKRAEAFRLVEIIATQLAQSGDRQMHARVVEICQLLGIEPPAVAQATVQNEADAMARGK